jgi:hypothetical protein
VGETIVALAIAGLGRAPNRYRGASKVGTNGIAFGLGLIDQPLRAEDLPGPREWWERWERWERIGGAPGRSGVEGPHGEAWPPI